MRRPTCRWAAIFFHIAAGMILFGSGSNGNRNRARQFISALGGATLPWPLVARPQQPERMRRIGVLVNFAADDAAARTGASRGIHAGAARGRLGGQVGVPFGTPLELAPNSRRRLQFPSSLNVDSRA